MRVVIVSKTKMTGRYCVGGLTADGRESLRLLQADGSNQPPETPYDVGEVWEIDGQRKPDCLPPHLEDFLATQRHQLGREPRLAQFLSERIRPWRGGPEVLFDGLIRFTGNRSGYISRQNKLPSCSTGFWLADRPLRLVQDKGKASYHYARKDLICRITYVGAATPPAVITPGTLVRVSLARGWRPEDTPDLEERCYLQLSGYYDDAESFSVHKKTGTLKPADSEEEIPS
jgi:hypothetical protein